MAKNSKPETKPSTPPESAAPSAPARKAPSLEEVVASGYSLRAAHSIVAFEEALAAGMSEEDAAIMKGEALKDYDARTPQPAAKEPDAPSAPAESAAPVSPVNNVPHPPSRPAPAENLEHARSTRAAIDVIAVSDRGFWRCGRKYHRKEATRLFVDELKPGELDRLMVENAAKNLIVKTLDV